MKLLVDSDFLVALYKPADSNHLKAVEVFKKIEHELVLVALNLVFQESTTVVSKQMGMIDARKFFNSINKLITEKLSLDQELEIQSWRLFFKQTKKGSSFIDCANLAVVERYKLDGILSFDEFYPEKLMVTA